MDKIPSTEICQFEAVTVLLRGRTRVGFAL